MNIDPTFDDAEDKEGSWQFIKQVPVNVYTRAAPDSTRYALRYGLLGGAITGLLFQYPAHLLLDRVMIPDKLTDTFAFQLMGGEFLVALAGLSVTLILLSSSWTTVSRREQVLTGASIGILFAFSIYTTLIGATSALLASRTMLPIMSLPVPLPTGDKGSAQLAPYLVGGLYHLISESTATLALMLIGLTLAGALLGRFLLVQPVQEGKKKKRAANNALNATFPLLILILPFICYVALVMIVVVYTLMDNSLADSAKQTGFAYNPSLSILQIVTALPIVGQLVLQLAAVLWIRSANVDTLHRTTSYFVEIIYGLGASAGQIALTAVINPTFLLSIPGALLIGISASFAVVFTILCHRKLRTYSDSKLLVMIPTRRVLQAGLTVLIIGWLMVDALVLRPLLMIVMILISMIPQPDNPPNLNEIIGNALHRSTVFSVVGLVVVLLAGLVPLWVIAWFVSRQERKRSNVALT